MDDNKCLSCELSNFGNLHYQKAELEGGELYVLRESIKQKKLLPCQLTYPLDPTFDIWKEVYISLKNDGHIEELDDNVIVDIPPMVYFTWQIFFDMKASLFLALTAHYRSAIQLLRSSLENIIVSRYFRERLRLASGENKREKEYKKFLNWSEKTENKIEFNGSREYLYSKCIITP